MLEFRYDTQLLIEGHDLDEDVISDYFTENFKGDCLLAVGDEDLIKIHFHTNEPWKVLPEGLKIKVKNVTVSSHRVQKEPVQAAVAFLFCRGLPS